MKRQDAGFRSREFAADGPTARYSLDAIPMAMWKQFRRLCLARKVSVRAALLGLIKRELEQGGGR